MPNENDFVRRLRMNNIFPTDGFNPLQAPQRPDFDAAGFLNQINNQHNIDQMHNENRQDDLYYRAKGDRLAEIARQAAIQNPKTGISNLWTQKNGQTMNQQLGDQGGRTIAARLGSTLDQERASLDPGTNVQPQYIPAEDQPTSQKSLLERGEQTITGNKQAAIAKATADLALEGRKQSNEMEQIGAKTKSQKEINEADNKSKMEIELAKERAALEKGDPVAKRQEEARQANDKQRRDAQKAMASETLDSINTVMDEKGKLTPEAAMAVGGTRWLGLQNLPGTKTHTADRRLENIQSRSILALIGELKSQSRTGATGFGNMSNKDLAVIETAANRLDKAGSQEEYEKELAGIRDKIKLILEDAAENKATDEGPRDKVKMSPADLIRKHGG